MRNSPVKYSEWKSHEEPFRTDGNPVVAIGVLCVLLGGLFGLLALIG